MFQTLSSLSFLLLCVGCGGSGSGSAPVAPSSSSGFLFDTMADRPLDLQVVVDGAPVGGASVQVRQHPDGVTRPGVYFDGVTDRDGRASASLRVPESVGRVELIVHQPGAFGPYSDESRRAADGPTAVSSLTDRSVEELSDVRIVMSTIAGGVR